MRRREERRGEKTREEKRREEKWEEGNGRGQKGEEGREKTVDEEKMGAEWGYKKENSKGRCEKESGGRGR